MVLFKIKCVCSTLPTLCVFCFQESVELPLTHPEYYEEMGIKPPKGVILYGAPGTGQFMEQDTKSSQAFHHVLVSASAAAIGEEN